jgi:ADP-ribose pyrophosphatase YjhB (NUDIX family)
MTAPIDLFQFCPRCGQPCSAVPGSMVLRCQRCSFLYHFNPAVAVGVFLEGPDRRVLLVERDRDPARGMLALPGGFVDIGETAEDALRREVREEVDLQIEELRFLCSAANQYLYADVTYPVLDLFFVAIARDIVTVAALDGVASLHWFEPRELPLERIAFPSVRSAAQIYQGLRASASPASQ